MENMVHENMTSLLNVLPNATNTTSLRGQAFHNPLGDQPGLQYFFMVCMGMLSVFGTLGNLMVILAVCVMPELRTTSNYFIVNLAFADFMITAVSMPSNLLGAFVGSDYFHHRPMSCWVIGSLCAMGCISSCWNIAMISVNRYVLICRYSLYERIYTKRNTLLLCIAVWILIYLIDLPTHAGWTTTRFSDTFFVCTFDHRHQFSYFYVFGGVFTPVGAIFLSYLGIYLRVRHSNLVRNQILRGRQDNSSMTETKNETKESLDHAKLQSRPCGNNRRSFRENVRVARALFRIFLIFLVMWTPITVILLLRARIRIDYVWYLLSLLLAHGNSSVNCVIYALSLDHFREGYWKVFEFWMKKIRKHDHVIKGDGSVNAPSTIAGNHNSVTPAQNKTPV